MTGRMPCARRRSATAISVRPFYHMRYPDRPTITKSFDLLASGLEITTGAQREHRSVLAFAQDRDPSLKAIDMAKAESVDAILDAVRLKQEGRVRAVAAIGCLVQRYGPDLVQDLPEVDYFIGVMHQLIPLR